MIFRYVTRGFKRRRVRTLLMVLSLLISTSLIVAMAATVESIRQSTIGIFTAAVGSNDVTITRADTSPDRFVPEATVTNVLDANDRVEAVFGRIEGGVELSAADLEPVSGNLVAMDLDEPDPTFFVVRGEHVLADRQASIYDGTANSLGVDIGDTVTVTYSFPLVRSEGSPAPEGASVRRATGSFVISAIVGRTGTEEAEEGGIIVGIDDARTAFGLEGRSERLTVFLDPALYESSNSEENALAVRDVAVDIQSALDDSYVVRAIRAGLLDELASVFIIVQAGVNTYGLMSLAVVGLLVYTLIMTNVQEQRRELAVLRILGSQRNLLFRIVIVEVIVVGIVGVGLGVLAGTFLTRSVVVPLIVRAAAGQGATGLPLVPSVSLTAVLPAIASAGLVLLASAIRPAREASRTKIMHAINPGVADNLQIEDLEALRERRPNTRLLLIGVAVLAFALLLNVQVIAEALGNRDAESLVFVTTLVLLALGMVCVVFILTRPMERLILRITRLFAPRMTYFAQRNVGRNVDRNTLISLLILLSGVFPSYLATESATSIAQVETDTRLSLGAPARTTFWSPFSDAASRPRGWLRPSEVEARFTDDASFESTVGLTDDYWTDVRDSVALRQGRMRVIGVAGDLNDVLYGDLVEFSAGGPDAFRTILQNPRAAIISTGMAEGLAVELGQTILAEGAGFDHMDELVVVGIADRIPGFRDIGRTRSRMMDRGIVLVSLEGYRLLSTPPAEYVPVEDPQLIRTVLATTPPGIDVDTMRERMYEKLDDPYRFWIRVAEQEIEFAYMGQAQSRVLLLALTALSFVTAVFGVFAVTFVTIYSRRREIGMLKAIGVRKREMNSMLSLEAIAMTVGAAITGILAGASMSWLYTFVSNLVEERPTQLSLDGVITPAIIIMVVTASILGTIVSARRIIRKKAVEILRMS